MADGKHQDNSEHEDNRDKDGYKKDGYDHTKTKDGNESSGGKHSKGRQGHMSVDAPSAWEALLAEVPRAPFIPDTIWVDDSSGDGFVG